MTKENGPHRGDDGEPKGAVNLGDGESLSGSEPGVHCKSSARHPNHVAALRLAAAGIKIIPCYYDPRTGKKPPIHHKDHIKQATADPTIIDGWFNTPNGGWQIGSLFVKNEHVLIGLPTGATNGIDVVDIDVKNEVDGHLTVPGWEKLATVLVETPTGGHHL